MKQKSSSFLLALLLSMATNVANAYDAQIDGIYYNFSGDEAEVTYETMSYGYSSDSYSGLVVIPETVTYNANTYSVTSIGNHAFDRCRDLTSVTIPEGVISIGEYAFYYCSGLTSVTIPNSVTTIGYDAFSGCGSLTSVNIGNSVTSIVGNAFSPCSGLTSIKVAEGNTTYDSRNDCNAIIETATNTLIIGCQSSTIPDGVASIGEKAFNECGSLTSIAIPGSVTSIGNYAFSDCGSLISINIGNSVTSIGAEAFRNCFGLTSIKVAEGNTTYDSRNDCNAIIETASNTLIAGCQNTTIPNSVTCIGTGAFSNCRGLTSVTIPNSVTSIGEKAFYDCWSLTSITIPGSVTSIGDAAFERCSGLTSVTIPNSVTSIGNYAFYGCSSMTSVTIPGSVTSIGNYAFSNCNMTSVTISEGVTSIGSYAFERCRGLTSVIIPGSVTSIGWHAFQDCTSLTSVTISEGVTSIGDYAFRGCSGLTSVTIPNSLTSIGDYAFRLCSGLTSVTIGSGLTSIGNYAFSGCNGLTKVIVPDIAAWCGISFGQSSANPLDEAHHLYSDETTEITDLVIPNDVTSVSDWAFFGCSGLTSATIGSGVTSIGNGVFSGCNGLTSIEVAEGNTKYDSRNGCNAIIETASNRLIMGCKNTTFPEDVTSIGDYSFYLCSSLTSIIIPEGVTFIGNRAFLGCSGLTSVTIPNSVMSIGIDAFSGCSALTSVIVDRATPPDITNYGTFSNQWNTTLYVPYGSKSAYEAADEWKDFKEIVEINTVNVGGTGFATYCSECDLDFSEVSGLKAYIASGFSPSTGKLVLTRVTEVPAGEGLYIVGDEGRYYIPATTTDMLYSNLLKGVTSATTIYPTDGDNTNFILANGSHGVAFYSLSEAGELAAGKAYLQLPTASVSEVKAISVIFDDDDATGIASPLGETEEGAAIYNLQGQQVNAPKSGLYIINGKKVLIK